MPGMNCGTAVHGEFVPGFLHPGNVGERPAYEPDWLGTALFTFGAGALLFAALCVFVRRRRGPRAPPLDS